MKSSANLEDSNTSIFLPVDNKLLAFRFGHYFNFDFPKQ